jgi:hypothetical protein
MKKYLFSNHSIFLLAIAAIFCFTSCNPTPCCTTFDSTPFTVGTTYNQPAYNPSSLAFQTCSFDVTIENLVISGTNYFNFGKIEAATANFGTDHILNTNNVTFLFKNTGTPITDVTFEYLDLGGTENLSVNGVLHSGDLTAAPANLGGVNVSVSQVPITGGKKGTVKLNGSIQNFSIGGQEFFLDNICRK